MTLNCGYLKILYNIFVMKLPTATTKPRRMITNRVKYDKFLINILNLLIFSN